MRTNYGFVCCSRQHPTDLDFSFMLAVLIPWEHTRIAFPQHLFLQLKALNAASASAIGIDALHKWNNVWNYTINKAHFFAFAMAIHIKDLGSTLVMHFFCVSLVLSFWTIFATLAWLSETKKSDQYFKKITKTTRCVHDHLLLLSLNSGRGANAGKPNLVWLVLSLLVQWNFPPTR